MYCRDELANITDYLYIQSIRYQNAFTYCVDIEESLYEYQVPKLILQPIIENAFKHGFKNKMTERDGDRIIQVMAERIEESLVITIQDNGNGISPESLSDIMEHISEPDSKLTTFVWGHGSIGLLNVHQRIRLQYGAEYGLQITSEGEKKGVSVSVRIPCYKAKL